MSECPPDFVSFVRFEFSKLRVSLSEEWLSAACGFVYSQHRLPVRVDVRDAVWAQFLVSDLDITFPGQWKPSIEPLAVTEGGTSFGSLPAARTHVDGPYMVQVKHCRPTSRSRMDLGVKQGDFVITCCNGVKIIKKLTAMQVKEVLPGSKLIIVGGHLVGNVISDASIIILGGLVDHLVEAEYRPLEQNRWLSQIRTQRRKVASALQSHAQGTVTIADLDSAAPEPLRLIPKIMPYRVALASFSGRDGLPGTARPPVQPIDDL